MSDFLDRLAARAIGSDATLAPRLPSLFEPLPRAPIMPSLDEREAPARPRDASPARPVAPNAAPPPRALAPVPESIAPRTARNTPAEHAPLPMPERVAADAPRAPMPPPPRAAVPVRAMSAEPARAASAPERAAASSPSVSPRQSRVAPARQEAVRTPAPGGALLPAPVPVFATTGGTPAPVRPGHAAAMHSTRNAQADHGNRAGSEPVVHVSIGRLEVRAAPAAAAPPRRREEAQPSSLDDYLRQRGKASP
ncbi:MAG: hypothetical protein ACTHJO_08875 [Rhodanobacter sp.]